MAKRKNERESFIIEKIGMFGRRVTELAEKRKINNGESIEKQASNMGIGKSNFSKYKETIDNDKDIPCPRADVLIKIAKYYNVSLDYLMGLTDYQERINTKDEEFMRKMCDYTGLNEQSLDFLHKHNKTEAEKLIFNNLFCDTELLPALYKYLEEPLLEIFVDSDYYHRLPVERKFKQELEPIYCAIENVNDNEYQNVEKINYANLIEILPKAKKRFSEKITGNLYLKTKIAFDFAKIFTNRNSALSKIRDNYIESDKQNDSFQRKYFLLLASYDFKLLKEILEDIEPIGKNRFNRQKRLFTVGEQIDIIRGIDSYLNFSDKYSEYNYQDESLSEEDRIIKAINFIRDLQCEPDISEEDLISEKETNLKAINDLFRRRS